MKYLAVFYASRIRKAGNQFLTNELEKAGLKGIVPSHGDIIKCLLMFGAMPMQELAKKVDRTKATVTVLIDKLEKLELVKRTRSSKDNRVTLIELTQKGLDFKPVFEKISHDLNEKAYKGFSTEEAELVETLMDRIRKNLE
uniref:MarR family winged helix-turn-helix transcriptional regulator n=1 Tax=Succinivibrio sp. TaxID=2053619 RepID=UPI003FEECA39